jgi:hypothetical protein
VGFRGLDILLWQANEGRMKDGLGLVDIEMDIDAMKIKMKNGGMGRN